MKAFLKKYPLGFFYITSALLLIVLGFVFGSIYFSLVPPKDIPSSKYSFVQKPVVMIMPHQDDEMFMAGKFLSFIERGHPAYAAIATDGGNSHMLVILQQQGFKNLDRQSFSHARNVEFFDSMKGLGIPVDHVFFMNPGGVDGSTNPTYMDGSLTEDKAHEIIQKIYNKIGDGIYMTVAGGHPDHVALEHALRDFPNISKKLFFPIDTHEASEKFFVTSAEQEKKHAALGAYNVWDPAASRYAVGQQSVKPLLQQFGNGELEYYFEK